VKQQFLRVNPTTCVGHGICAELLPEMIRLDDWGYPIIDGDPVPEELLRLVRRTVAACPALALFLSDQAGPRRPRSAGTRSAGRG
jgi:ferredoxin